MPYRDSIVQWANWWADPGEYKPTKEDLIGFFTGAGAEAAPTDAEADKSFTRSTGAIVQGQVKHWCGIFACYVLRAAGLTAVRWTLLGGKIINTSGGKQVGYIPGRDGMRPGDIAIIKGANHHFIVVDIDYESNWLQSVDGNTSGQMIRRREKQIYYTAKDRKDAADVNIYGYYRIVA